MSSKSYVYARDLKGYRRPYDSECSVIEEYFTLLTAKNIRFRRMLAVIMFVCAFFTSLAGIKGSLVCSILCCVFLIVGVGSLLGIAGEKRLLNRVKMHKYKVINGCVCEIRMLNRSGRVYVRFSSHAGETCKMLLVVRKEGIEMGSRLLLVYIYGSKRTEVVRVFSEYMFSNQAMKYIF